jgi:uncharacterized protein (DUF362 family)
MPLAAEDVFVAQGDAADYRSLGVAPPVELPEGTPVTQALLLLRSLLRDAKLDATRYGTADWNPLADLINAGAKVVLKPNWVLDHNMLPGGSFEAVVTHPSVIEAVLHYVVKADPGQVTVGDAPLQNCDFDGVREKCGLERMLGRFRQLGHVIGIRDFRLTKVKDPFGAKVSVDVDSEKYCLFNLHDRSWLAPITEKNTEFRVTGYEPDVLKRHHYPGTHRYLIAREIIDADVVISLPKLKTHKKAGVTGALKNMVGINGYKEYLPHHRKGGSKGGGDCYQGGGRLRRLAEDFLDRANKGKGRVSRYLNTHSAGLALRLDNMLFGNDGNLQGAWHGNDTVWRTCLDLQKVLHYGKGDGELAQTRQREVITITDAIIAGDGDGPLAPSSVSMGTMTLGTNSAALEWVHCLLMRLAPEKIKLVACAFADDVSPLAEFSPRDVRVHVNGELLSDLDSVSRFSHSFTPPEGWRGACELENGSATPCSCNTSAGAVCSASGRHEEVGGTK